MIERLHITLRILWYLFDLNVEWNKHPATLVETRPDYDNEQISNLLTDVEFANRVDTLESKELAS